MYSNVYSNVFDICVVGAGMVGSASAKYCAVQKKTVCLIGPLEPKRNDYENHEIFGSHYDEARITRKLDTNPVWSYLASKSIARYRQIEKESGIFFYTDNGYIFMTDTDCAEFKDAVNSAERSKVEYELLSRKRVRERFPFMMPNSDMQFMFDKTGGAINPRRLVHAQKIIAKRHGAHVIDDVVVAIRADENDESIFKVQTKNSGNIRAHKVIICVGAFFDHHALIPNHKELDLIYRSAQVCRIPVDESVQQKVKNMPSVVFSSHVSFDPDRDYDGDDLAFYMMAPVRYPDGKYYIKLGYSHNFNKSLFKLPHEISDWFKKTDLKTGALLAKDAKYFIPCLNISKFTVDHCVLPLTSNNLPYIGEVSPGICVFAGCNGYSAKSSDEIGRIVATFSIDGTFDCGPFGAEMFRPKFKNRARI